MNAGIARAFVAACVDELAAPKPGNVHVYAAGHGMTVAQFEASAAAAAAGLCARGARVGARIRAAVDSTLMAVGTNTNLGIVLLCAPLAAAADPAFAAGGDGSGLRRPLARVLDGLDVADAAEAFGAIVRASPAGLGRAGRHDVHAPPRVALKEAMAAAADRDLIARQYASGFADVFDVGVACHAAAAARWGDPRWATLAVYLRFLAGFPDSHVVRKHGAGPAAQVRESAGRFDTLLWRMGNPDELLAALLAWDAELKERGLNPGTCADLTVATSFCVRLQSILPQGVSA